MAEMEPPGGSVTSEDAGTVAHEERAYNRCSTKVALLPNCPTLREDRCRVGGQMKGGTALIEPGADEIFVYTGGSPTDVVIDGMNDSDDTSGVYDDGPMLSRSFSSAASSFSDNDGASAATQQGDSGARGGESSAGDAVDAGGGFPPAY